MFGVERAGGRADVNAKHLSHSRYKRLNRSEGKVESAVWCTTEQYDFKTSSTHNEAISEFNL